MYKLNVYTGKTPKESADKTIESERILEFINIAEIKLKMQKTNVISIR